MKTIEISPKTIFLIFGIILGIYLVFILRDLFFSLLISLILVSALSPAVNYLEQQKLPRGLAVGLVFFSFIGLFTTLIIFVLPPFIAEVNAFFRNLPALASNLGPTFTSMVDLNQISTSLPNITNQALSIISGFLSNIVFLITTLFFTFYALMEEKSLENTLKNAVPDKYYHFTVRAIRATKKRMSSWFWGEITLMTVIGLLTFMVLTILGVKYALPLAIIAGILEAVPTVGPIISAIPAILVTLGNPSLLIGVIIAYIVIQQLENNLIVPVVMRKAVGMSPIVILFALIVGGKLGGSLGVLLAIPVALLIETIIIEWRKGLS